MNHMGTGAAGESSYSEKLDPAIYALGNDAWHWPLRMIMNNNSRYEVTHYGVGGLPDLNTANKDIQSMEKAFLQKCIDCGADGFRVDTAKHIELPADEDDIKSDFWTSVFDGLVCADGKKPYVYAEVLQGGADNFKEYSKYMNLTSSNYGETIRKAVGFDKKKAAAGEMGDKDITKIESYKANDVPQTELITWVESHDTYANDSEESTGMNDVEIKNGWAIIASRSGANPLFFNRPAGTGKLDGKIGQAGNTMWKDKDVSAVNNFRKEMLGQDEKLVDINDEAVIIERGTAENSSKKGMTIVNLGDEAVADNIEVNLPDGIYKNKGETKTSFKIKNGKLSGKIPSGISVVYGNPNEKAGLDIEMKVVAEIFGGAVLLGVIFILVKKHSR